MRPDEKKRGAGTKAYARAKMPDVTGIPERKRDEALARVVTLRGQSDLGSDRTPVPPRIQVDARRKIFGPDTDTVLFVGRVTDSTQEG